MAQFRDEKIDHAKRMIRRGELTNNQIRKALTAVFGSAISPSELKRLKQEVYAEPKPAKVGAPIVLNTDGTWRYVTALNIDPAT